MTTQYLWQLPELHVPAAQIWHHTLQNAQCRDLSSYSTLGHPHSTFQRRDFNSSRKRPRSGYSSEMYDSGSMYEIFKGTPWRDPLKMCKIGIEGLTEEIEEFYNYIRPQPIEKKKREEIVSRVKNAILEKWPLAEVDVFGSFKTGLYLPSGDIDMVVRGNWDVIPPIFDLERLLIDKQIGEKTSFKVLEKATVPIIKFKDTTSGIRVDITFNQVNCTEAAAFVMQWCEKYPTLPKLTMVLKQYLSDLRLNEVFHGGLSSYSLTLLILSFLQLKTGSKSAPCDISDVGSLLVEFLQFYGDHFNYDTIGIRVRDGGTLMKKDELRASLVSAGGAPPPTVGGLLCIEDPLTPGNDVARGSYNVQRVRDAFRSAYAVLHPAVHPTLQSIFVNTRYSILGRIIRIPDHKALSRLPSFSGTRLAEEKIVYHYPPFHYNNSNHYYNTAVSFPNQAKYSQRTSKKSRRPYSKIGANRPEESPTPAPPGDDSYNDFKEFDHIVRHSGSDHRLL